MMADPIAYVLGGIVIAFTSGTIGRFTGSNGRVKEDHCGERRLSCTTLINSKLDTLTASVNKLEKTINDKIV